MLGLAEGRGPEPGALYLRMDDFPARLVIVPGERERLLGQRLGGGRRAGAGRGRAGPGGGRRRGQGRHAPPSSPTAGSAQLLRCDDPAGNRLEFFCGAALEHHPALSPYGNRFVTGDQGLGHVVLPVTDDDAARCASTPDVLGFRLRDSMRMAPELFGLPPSGPPLWMRFLGCGPRHHCSRWPRSRAAAGIVHLMIEVATLDDVGRAMDRCARRGAPVSATLGRHANDLMVSFYVRTPSGFDIEYGTDGRGSTTRTWVSRRDHRAQPVGPPVRAPAPGTDGPVPR